MLERLAEAEKSDYLMEREDSLARSLDRVVNTCSNLGYGMRIDLQLISGTVLLPLQVVQTALAGARYCAVYTGEYFENLSKRRNP